MRSRTVFVTLSAFLLLLGSGGWAHQLVPDDGSHVDAASALVIEDPDLSQVVYHPVTEQSAEIWLTFDGVEGQEFYMQLGVPYLERLTNYRPALVLLGPGLPDIETPLDVPEGLGGVAFPSAGVTPEYFNEHFTGTESWILLEQTYSLPADGQYYVVAYHPGGEVGKLWVSVGRREEFGLKDLFTFRAVVMEVREFHEVADEPLPPLPFILVTISDLLRALFWFLWI